MNYSYLITGECIQNKTIENFNILLASNQSQRLAQSQIQKSQQKNQQSQQKAQQQKALIKQAELQNAQLTTQQKKQIEDKKIADKKAADKAAADKKAAAAKLEADIKAKKIEDAKKAADANPPTESTYSKVRTVVNEFYLLFDDKHIAQKEKEKKDMDEKQKNIMKQREIDLEKEQATKKQQWDTEHTSAQNIANTTVKQAETVVVAKNTKIKLQQQTETQKLLQQKTQKDTQRQNEQAAQARALAQRQSQNDAQRNADAQRIAANQRNQNAQANAELEIQKQYDAFIAQQKQIINTSGKYLEKQLGDRISQLTNEYNNSANSLQNQQRSEDAGVRQRARDQLNSAMANLENQTNQKRNEITNTKQNIMNNLNAWKQQFNNPNQRGGAINAQQNDFNYWADELSGRGQAERDRKAREAQMARDMERAANAANEANLNAARDIMRQLNRGGFF